MAQVALENHLGITNPACQMTSGFNVAGARQPHSGDYEDVQDPHQKTWQSWKANNDTAYVWTSPTSSHVLRGSTKVLALTVTEWTRWSCFRIFFSVSFDLETSRGACTECVPQTVPWMSMSRSDVSENVCKLKSLTTGWWFYNSLLFLMIHNVW